MSKIKTIAIAMAVAAGLAATPTFAAGEGAHVERQNWSFGGLFGTYDQNQLQRGFQVFREVCASCHGAHLLAFRNLSEENGPSFSEEQVKALAAEYEVADASAEGGVRAAVPADRWPSPFASEAEAAEAMGGSFPPDFSVLAKARGVKDEFPTWIFNYFTGYQEGGADYIYALLTGYPDEVPEDFELPDGKSYNNVFPGHAIGMGAPLADGSVTYEPGPNGETVPETLDQYAHDVASFMMWAAEPHLVSRKETGVMVLIFLIGFAGLLYATKRRLWKGIEH
jgi:ubiquinol-cytochrome c reductase cytochrome c1 subunit